MSIPIAWPRCAAVIDAATGQRCNRPCEQLSHVICRIHVEELARARERLAAAERDH